MRLVLVLNMLSSLNKDIIIIIIIIMHTILVAFSLKTSRACTDMLSYENDAIKFTKAAKNTNSTCSTCSTCTIVPRLVKLVFFSKLVWR